MASLILIMVLAQHADVKMDLWLVSACRRRPAAEHTGFVIPRPPSSIQDVIPQHVTDLNPAP